MLLPRRSLRRAHRPGRPGRAASCPADRAGSAMTGAPSHACGRLPAVPAAERFQGPDGVLHQGIDKRVLPERVRTRVAGDPAVLRSRSELVPLTPITAVARWRAVMDLVPSPGEDRCPRRRAFRAEHPDIEIAGPAGSRTAGGRLTGAARSWSSNSGLCQLPGRLDELLASGQAGATRAARSRSDIAGASRMPYKGSDDATLRRWSRCRDMVVIRRTVQGGITGQRTVPARARATMPS
jgi:hypothetical protein